MCESCKCLPVGWVCDVCGEMMRSRNGYYIALSRGGGGLLYRVMDEAVAFKTREGWYVSKDYPTVEDFFANAGPQWLGELNVDRRSFMIDGERVDV